MLSTLNVRSDRHNSCEDSVFVKEDDKYIWGIIADGCSTGIKSHFASQVLAYFIQAEGQYNITTNYTIRRLRAFLADTMQLFRINDMNLLSTCILFTYYKETKTLIVRVLGDGVYYVDDVEYIIDQNNTPDYLAYHVGDNDENFEEYLNKYQQSIYQNVDRFMICSDGIQNIDRPVLHQPSKYDKNILFVPPTSSNYLERMWNKLKMDKYQLNDDLTIVSYAST